MVGRFAQIERLNDPSYQRAIDSGLGIVEVHHGDGYAVAIERRISEIRVGFSCFLDDWHQHKLQFDLSRLERRFAADPDAVIDGEPAPIAKAGDQEDFRFRAMVQFYF